MLTLLTPTGERPDAFALCKTMMLRQTYDGPVRWIIVDDGRKAADARFSKNNWSVEVIRPDQLWSPGENTQGRNLSIGVRKALEAKNPIIVPIEDDDHYKPEWLETVAKHAPRAELIGERFARYYNVRVRRWQRLGNAGHASLRCSAMRGGAVHTFLDVLTVPYKYYDLKLWGRHESRALFDTQLTCGIKGMPGRPGIAVGHDGLKGNEDPRAAVLREWIGSDADWYLPYYEGPYAMTKQELVVLRPFRYNRRNFQTGELFPCAKRIDVEILTHAKKIGPAPAVMKTKPEAKRPAPPPEPKEEPPAAEPVAASDDEAANEEPRQRRRGRLSIGSAE